MQNWSRAAGQRTEFNARDCFSVDRLPVAVDAEVLYQWRQLSFMELWHILVICILMVPAFLVANYIIVKRIVRERKRMEDRMERAISANVARNMGVLKSSNKYRSKPRFGSKQRR